MKKRFDFCVTALFLAFLSVMLLGLLFLPRSEFSTPEKRYLVEFPHPDWQSVASGSWGERLETWLADHLPGRTFFVGLNAYYERALGLQNSKDIRVLDGRLVEAPAESNPAAIQRNLNAISSLAGTVQQDITLAIVPSAGWAMGNPDYRDDEIIGDIYAEADVATLDLTGIFAGHPDWYFRTDHHWNSSGAWAGYAAIVTALGKEPRLDFARELIPACFQGSTYSRSALWLTEPENLELWHGSDNLTVLEGETTHSGVFYRENLEEADKYTVFLGGNHPLVHIQNPEGTGKLLVIRDSYSNLLGCFLAESYADVTLVDLRYYKQPVSALAAEGYDDILILYSLSNFLTDQNLVFLR